MSPVSRGRKPKKNKTRKKSLPPKVTNVPVDLVGDRPAWFDDSVRTVVDQADVLLAASGPRELEQATAELLGAHLHRAITEHQQGLRFTSWFAEVRAAATDRVNQPGVLHLLYGLTSIGPRRQPIPHVDQVPDEWLRLVPDVKATGRVVKLRDVYGSRLAFIAEYAYPGGVDPHVFLFDVEASDFVALVQPGVYDDVAAAAAAWRAAVGDTAKDAEPVEVRSPEELLALVEVTQADVMGDESQAAMDNWFRAPRRIEDLASARPNRGLPRSRSLFDDIPVEPMSDAFAAWYGDRHGVRPDPATVEDVATVWLEGTLPETYHSVSPRRLKTVHALVGDWGDDPSAEAVLALLPEWVRWHGEQAGIASDLLKDAVRTA
jgi:hypothetical protein